MEILYFDVCPNHAETRRLVERVAGGLSLRPEIRLVEVRDAEAADRLRFLGSPTVRVNGRDVEPGAEDRREFTLSCRVYDGLTRTPDEAWIRASLGAAA